MPVTLRRIGRQAFHALVDASAHLRPQLLDLICDEMASAQDQMITLGCKSAEERVATFFLTIARQTGADLSSPVEIALPMRRQDIADYLGLTLETVCRTISKLKRDKVISVEAQRTILRDQEGERQRLTQQYDAELNRLRALWAGAAPGRLGPIPAPPSSPVPTARPASGA